MKKRFLAGLVIAVFLFTSFGCGLSNITITPTPIFPTRAVLLESPTPPPTQPAPSQAAPVEETSAPETPTRTPRPVVTSAPPPDAPEGMMYLKIFMVAVGDNGASGKKIGCDDSIIPVNIQVARTQGVLRAALTKLLSVKDRDYGESGLVNALYQSDLSIESLAIQDGEAVIRLTGSLKSGGTCDDPRIIAQIEETALQFSTVQTVSIYVNGAKIQNLLSGRG